MLPLKPPYNILYFINILLLPNICTFWDIETFLHAHPIFSALPNLTFLSSETHLAHLSPNRATHLKSPKNGSSSCSTCFDLSCVFWCVFKFIICDCRCSTSKCSCFHLQLTAQQRNVEMAFREKTVSAGAPRGAPPALGKPSPDPVSIHLGRERVFASSAGCMAYQDHHWHPVLPNTLASWRPSQFPKTLIPKTRHQWCLSGADGTNHT